jgi:ATP-dependent 26S proteasome regulatory subunit
VTVRKPNAAGRADILRVHARKIKLNAEVETPPNPWGQLRRNVSDTNSQW